MSLETYIHAMPKAELGLQFEGAIPKQTLMKLADQNEVPPSKAFSETVKLLDHPNYERLPELIATVSQWVHYPDELSRMVYDVGVGLSKQNIRYVEMGVNPLLYMTHTGMSFEQFIEALNVGCDKAQRGWNVQINWVLNIPRDEPRRGDDIVRWATSAAGRKYGVIALGVSGREEAQPAAQFERSFKGAEKKLLSRIAHGGDKLGAEGVLDVLRELHPTRLIGGWGAADAPDVIQMLTDNDTPLDIAMARQLCMGRIATYADYPLRHLYDEGVKLTLTTHMPALYHTTLSDEYLALVEHNNFSVDELEDIALNAVRYSSLSDEEKPQLLAEFEQSYSQLRTEHLSQETT